MMSRKLAARRNHPARSAFIVRFASALTESGFPRMPARVFAALLATDSGRLGAAELAELLHVSLAAISGAVRYLNRVNLVSREPEPGSRRERYCVHSDVWIETMARKDRVLDRCEQSLREGLEALGRKSPAGERIAETLAFFEFMQTELPAMLERWRALRTRSGSTEVKRPTSAGRSKRASGASGRKPKNTP